MRKWQLCMMAAVLGTFGAICCANAQDSTTTITQQNTMSNGSLPDSDSNLYRAQEFSVDLFGSGSIDQYTIDHLTGERIRHNGVLGGGAGINLFLTRYLGIGGDANFERTAHQNIESPSGNLILRLPIADSGLAPYVFGGGGHQFDENDSGQNFAEGGGGIEFRFEKDIGLFVDARYVFAQKTENYGMARAGLRLNF
jgi:hypothetical protein